jgi:uncharacterized protein involved in exopolysaccharide biosynthesis
MSRRSRELIHAGNEDDWQRQRENRGDAGSRLPQIEVVTREGSEERPTKRRSPLSLLVWFLIAFALVAIPASIWNFSRPPVYRASAMVLTIVPEDRSGYGETAANLQHVAIQRSILLGRQLLEDTITRLQSASANAEPSGMSPGPSAPSQRDNSVTGANGSEPEFRSAAGPRIVAASDEATTAPQPGEALDGPSSASSNRLESEAAAGLTADDLLTMLAVEAVPQTNLVELSARGGDPALLARIVNEWLAAYEILREREIEAQVGDRLDKLGDRARRLEARIQSKRSELDAFRERFDIVTLGRDSNEAMARLEALQEKLSTAEAAVAAARAERERIERAIAEGRAVVPERLTGRLERLYQQAEEARAQVRRLRERYTDFFIQKDLNKRRIVERLEKIEQELADAERQGSQEALRTAGEAVETARGRVTELRQALTEQKVRASRFSSGFAEFESLKEDLAQLEEMQREVDAQRVNLETTVYADYPQIEIIEPAFAPRDPVEPDYGRDLMLTLIAATALGLLTVIVLTWLDAGSRNKGSSASVTGVRIWSTETGRDDEEAVGTRLPRQEQHPALGSQAAAAAGQPALLGRAEQAPRQLTIGEIEALWELADIAERQLIGLSLSGVQPQEARSIKREDIDLSTGMLRVPGEDGGIGARSLPLGPRLLRLFNEAEPVPAWTDQPTDQFEDLIQRLSLLAADAGIAEADEVDAQTLHDTYVIYLVRQGARLTRLSQVAGPMSGADARRFAPYAPPGASRPFEEVALIHPALA